MLALLGTAEILLLVLGITFALAAFVLWAAVLVDCIRNRALSDTERIVWVLVICLTHFVGALIYFLAGRRSGTGGSRPTAVP